jgi:hypothetical protein
MVFTGINYFAVIVAGLVYFFLGAIWYSPLLFVKPYMRYRSLLTGASDAALKPLDFVITAVAEILAAFVLAVLLESLGITTILPAIVLALFVVIAFSAGIMLVHDIYNGAHVVLWLINSSYNVVAFVLMAIILVLWQ